MTDFAIRAAIPKDAAAFLAYLREMLDEPDPAMRNIPIAPDELRSVDVQATLFADHAAEDNSVFLLAHDATGAIAGNINLRGLQRRSLRHVAYLGMGVARAHRRRGLGKQLMAAALAYADAHAIGRIELDVLVRNTRAIALYERFGFVVEGRRTKMVLMDGEYLDDLHMARVTI